MEAQDHNKTPPSGNGSHGVHVCHKCGWPFPNPHPSAKHRRAHKKVCGTVEGYKLVLSAVADEHLSDEDHKTPTVEVPNVVESTSTGKDVSGHGALPSRSEDEVFSDAVPDFLESGFNDQGRVELANRSAILVDKVAEKDLSTAQSLKERVDADVVQAQAPRDTSDLSGSNCPDLGSNFDNSGMLTYDKAGSEADVPHAKPEKQTDISEESKKCTSDNTMSESARENDKITFEKQLGNDVHQLDEHADQSLEMTVEFERRAETNLETVLGDDGIHLKHEYDDDLASSLPISEVVEKEAHRKGDGEIFSDSSLENVMAVTSGCLETGQEYASESASSTPIGEVLEKEAHKRDKIISDSSVTSESAETGQEYTSESASSTPIGEVLEKAAHKGDNIISDSGLENVMAVTSEHAGTRQEDAGELASSVVVSEPVERKVHKNRDKETFSGGSLENVMVVTGEHAETKSEVMVKSKKRKEMTSYIENAGETMQIEEQGSDILVPSTATVVVLSNAESLERQTDINDTVHVKVDVAAQTELAEDRMDEGEESVHMLVVPSNIPVIENAETMLEGFKDHKRMKFQQSVSTCSGGKLKGEENEMKYLLPKEIASEIKDLDPKEVSSISLSTELSKKSSLIAEEVPTERRIAIHINEGLNAAEIQKGEETYSLEEQHFPDISDSLQGINCSEKEMKVSLDTNSAAIMDYGIDQFANVKADDHDTSQSRIHGVAVSDNHERAPKENYASETIVPSESASDLCRTEASDLLGGKTEEREIDEIGSEEPMVGHLSGDINFTSKCISSHQESQISVEGTNHEHAEILTNSQKRNLDGILDSQEEVEKYKINKYLKGQEDRIDEAFNTSKSLEDEGNMEAKNSVDYMKKEELGSPGEAPPGSLPPADGSHSGKLNEDAHEIGPLPLHGKSDEGLVKQQPDSSIAEFSVESGSQADILIKEKRGKGDEASSTIKSLEGGENMENRTSVHHLKKKSLDSPVEAARPCSLPPADGSSNGKFGENAHEIGPLPLQGEFDGSFRKHQLDSSIAEFSAESGSQADSLEGNLGSVSVLSNLSDIPAVTETEVLKSKGSQPLVAVEKANSQNQEDASWGHHTDNSDVFEAPSFMTLVEPGTRSQKAAATSKIQTPNNPQQLDATSLKAGWFPLLTGVANESPGRKKNEEIIAKVTSWNIKPQHTPLKNLLGEASAQATAKSPNRKEDQPLLVQGEERAAYDDRGPDKTVGSILAPEALFDEPSTAEAAKEWNSPARYPAGIKRERRKAKGRPYWAQFVCCSSVH